MAPQLDVLEQLIHFLAAYVSPIVDPNNHTDAYTGMLPVLEQIQALKSYATSLANDFVSNLRALGRAAPSTPEFNNTVSTATRIFDAMIALNYLKMSCARLTNDFAMFKRAFQRVRATVPAAEAERVAHQSHDLHFFLAEPNAFLDTLKIAVHKEDRFEIALERYLGVLVDAAGRSDQSTPEVWAIRRCIVCSVLVWDDEGHNPFSNPTVRSARPIVSKNLDLPVAGPLSINSLIVFKSCVNWRSEMESDWTERVLCFFL
eukprot:c46361_g1_i1.p1 GENE.c46361_g1_i1~~c46361_g1_i1.p1  ORF type:complete len:286 (+),score=49.70 c46361_g1_i1:81-860(+)